MPMTLPERLRHLRVDLNGAPCGDLRRESQLAFSYRRDDEVQPSVGLLMPPRQLLYCSTALFPVMDVVTTAIYRYQRWQGAEAEEDRTLALRLFAGRGQTRAYPTTEDLLRFGRQACGVAKPAPVLARIAAALRDTLAAAKQDARLPKPLLAEMAPMWERGMAYAG